MMSNYVQNEDLLGSLLFFPKGAPARLREKALEDLRLISAMAVEVWPKSTGAIYGSLSFGEGKWKKDNGKILMTSDYDIYIILSGFFDYLKALRCKTEFKKAIVQKVTFPVSITFIWKPLVDFRLVSVQGKVIWGDATLESAFRQTKPPPAVNNVKIGYMFLIKAIASSAERRVFLESAVIRGFWAHVLSRSEFLEDWHNIFSLRYDLMLVEKDKTLSYGVKKVIRGVIENKLGEGKSSRFYTDNELFNTAKFLLYSSHDRARVRFRLKDFIHYICYKLGRRSLSDVFINFTKVRLDLFKSFVDLIDYNFNIKDINRLKAIVSEVERLLCTEEMKTPCSSNEMVNYCCKLMIELGDMYIHKAGG